MDRDPTEVPAKQEVQGREVAEAHKDLAVGSKSSLIQQVKQACATVTTPEGEDSLNVRVFEVPHQFFRPGDVVTGQIPARLEDSLVIAHTEAQAFQRGNSLMKCFFVLEWPRRGNNGGRIVGTSVVEL